ncbi:hypothetical protein SAMD00019534_095660, partial [Acytostelium subglobosum LB1]|uniref:hypothetical protein n=1 Tax=Acytostelium subglobosum LB1 TaxID=1410327 RepID=UPI000644B8DD
FSRTDIPCYSNRLNKRLIEDTSNKRLISYLCAQDRNSVMFAINSLLSRAYQGKLTLVTNAQYIERGQYSTCSLLDAIISTIVTFVEDPATSTYTMRISNNIEIVSKVIAILRNAILLAPNDSTIASHPTALTALVQVMHSHLKYRQGLVAGDQTVLSMYDAAIDNTPRYILEIFSKIAKKLPMKVLDEQQQQQQQQQAQVQGTFAQSDIQFMLFDNAKLPTLISTPPYLARVILETLDMSLFTFDNDDALLAGMEALELILRSKSSREQADIVLMRPICDPLFDMIVISPIQTNTVLASDPISSPYNVDTYNNNSNTQQQQPQQNGNNNELLSITPTLSTATITPAPQSPPQTLQLKSTPITFGNGSNLILRLIELLGHSTNDVQLMALNILLQLSKLSQKSRIVIAHCPGLVRHLCNLLSFKTGEHNLEMGKKSAMFLSYASKEPLNIPVLLPFEPLLAQIVLSDNPHTDIIANILIKLENNNN